MKKILLIIIVFILSVSASACDPNPTTQNVSLNTNITQSTIPLEHIGIELDKNEVCQGAIITLNPFFTPTNATNLNYTISFSEQNVVQFVPGSNNLQIEVIGEPSYMDQGTVGYIMITITSDFDSNINNSEQLYIYAIGTQPPQCML